MNARVVGLAAALLAAALAAGPAAAQAQAPAQVRLSLQADAGTGTPGEGWPLLAVIRNDEAFSVALDSIRFAVHPLSGAASAFHRMPLPGRLWQAGAGDSMILTSRLPAAATDAWLVMAFHLHTHDGVPFLLVDSLRETGHEDHLPVAALGRAGKATIEFWRVPPPAGTATGAGVLLLRDEGVTGDEDLRAAVDLASSGWTIVLVNAPGSGRTSGPADLAGPRYRAAALAALDTLAGTPGVRRDRLAIWGVGAGATMALLVAEGRPDLKAVVAQGAIPDLWAAWRAGDTPWRTAIGAAASRDSAAWRVRSPAIGLATLRVPTLVLHGERDVRSPALAVHAFVAALQHAGTPVESRFFGLAGRSFGATTAAGPARRFLGEALEAK